MSKLRDTMFDLISYKYLEADWDGYDSVKPDIRKLSYAWKSLKLLVDTKTPIPSIMISGSSEIGFYWSCKESDKYMEIEFYDEAEDGTKGDFFGFLINRGGDDYEGGEDIPVSEYTKSNIYKELKKTFPDSKLDQYQFDEYYFNLFYNGEYIFYEDSAKADKADKEIDEYFAQRDSQKVSKKLVEAPSSEAVSLLHNAIMGEPMDEDMMEILQKNFTFLLD